MEIVVYVIRQITDPNEAIKFLSTLENKVKANSDSLNLCKVLAAQIYLEKFNDFKNTKRLIEEIEETLDDAVGVTLVHGRFYAVASSYYRLVFHCYISGQCVIPLNYFWYIINHKNCIKKAGNCTKNCNLNLICV